MSDSECQSTLALNISEKIAMINNFYEPPPGSIPCDNNGDSDYEMVDTSKKRPQLSGDDTNNKRGGGRGRKKNTPPGDPPGHK